MLRLLYCAAFKVYMSFSLKLLKGGYIAIGEHYRVY